MPLGAEPVLLHRHSPSSRDSDGYTLRGTPTESTIQASVQPIANQDEIQRLPEGIRDRVRAKIYTNTQVLAADLDANRQPDRIIIDGVTHEVLSVSRQRSIIPHYRAYLGVVQEGAP